MVQVFSEQRAKFVNDQDDEITFTVPPYVFTYAPEWITKTLLWKLLVKDNKIRVIGTAKDAIEVTAKVEEKISYEKAEKQVESEVKISDNEIDQYSKMKPKELYEICISKGIEVEPKKSKDYYLEQLSK